MIELSGLIQRSVDFAKHGNPVEQDEWKKFEKMLMSPWPDYLEKDESNTYESE